MNGMDYLGSFFFCIVPTQIRVWNNEFYKILFSRHCIWTQRLISEEIVIGVTSFFVEVSLVPPGLGAAVPLPALSSRPYLVRREDRSESPPGLFTKGHSSSYTYRNWLTVQDFPCFPPKSRIVRSSDLTTLLPKLQFFRSLRSTEFHSVTETWWHLPIHRP